MPEWLEEIRVRLAVAPKNTTKERDESFPSPVYGTIDHWRIVEESAREARRLQQSSARPHYVASVYNHVHAVFYNEAPRDIQALLGEVERLRGLLDETGEQVQVLQAMLAGETTQEEVNMAYEHACDVGDQIWKGLK